MFYKFSLRLHQDCFLRRLKFIARSLFYVTETRALFGFIASRFWLCRIALHRPQLVERLHRPYQRADFKCWQRLDALKSHYQICEELDWKTLANRIARAPLMLASFCRHDEEVATLNLCYDSQFSKEGEWALTLRQGESRIYTVAISLHRHLDRRGLFIGCIQGPASLDSQATVRQLTRNLHGARPKDLVIDATRVIAELARCEIIEMVGDCTHIYRNLRKRRRVRFSYDAYGAECNALRTSQGTWLLPLKHARRSRDAVPSHKRAQVTRKYSMLDDMERQIRMAIQQAARPSVAHQTRGVTSLSGILCLRHDM